MLTHDMLMRSAFANARNRGLEIGRRIFVAVPLFHVYGYVKGVLSAILVGGTILLCKGKFLPEPALKFMKESRANDILCVPAQMRLMINLLWDRPMELPELHAVYCSASVCPAWIWPGIRETLRISDIATGYGMSETSSGSIQTRPTDSDEILCSRVGRLLDGGCAGVSEYDGHLLQYKIMNQHSGQPCENQEPGELWCRGPIVTQGYYNCPEVNAKVFTEDGWFKTGDCGYFDKNGYLVLSGRADDMYKINGENVSPKFLEDTVSGCLAVSVIQVVGVPDDRHGYVGAAFIQLHEDTSEKRQEVEQYCREHLAKFQVPKYFVYMTDVDWPRTATGKIRKSCLRERAIKMLGDTDSRQ